MRRKGYKPARLLLMLVLGLAIILPVHAGAAVDAPAEETETSSSPITVIDNDSGYITQTRADGSTTSGGEAASGDSSSRSRRSALQSTRGATFVQSDPSKSSSQIKNAELVNKKLNETRKEGVKISAASNFRTGSVTRTTTPARQDPSAQSTPTPAPGSSEQAVDLNDGKITKEEERQYDQTVQKTDQFVEKQADVINKIPGAQVDPDDLKAAPIEKKGFSLGDLNPIKWIFSPVIKLQEQVIRLEQEVMKLTGPIAGLQPSMLKLNDKMEEVRGTMDETRKAMQSVQGSMGSVQQSMGGVRTDMKSMRSELGNVGNTMSGIRRDLQVMRHDINSLKRPIVGLRQPIVALQEPLDNLSDPLSTVGARMRNLDKQLGELKALISLVLTAIFVAAALVAVGTPLAAIIVWRNKNKWLPKPKPDQLAEERSLETAVNRAEKKVSAPAAPRVGKPATGAEKPPGRRGPLPT